MELAGKSCSGCGRRFVGGSACPSCGRRDGVEEILFSGRGSIHSYSRVHVPTPAHQSRAPYLLALVDLEEGARLTCQIETADPAAVAIDGKVAFDREQDGVPMFRPAS
jgi:uncharacterized OB-fold protein